MLEIGEKIPRNVRWRDRVSMSRRRKFVQKGQQRSSSYIFGEEYFALESSFSSLEDAAGKKAHTMENEGEIFFALQLEHTFAFAGFQTLFFAMIAKCINQRGKDEL